MVDYFEQMFIVISRIALVPCMLLLAIFLFFNLWGLGGFAVEWVTERRKFKVDVTALIRKIHKQGWDSITGLIEGSGLLKYHKQTLQEFIAAADLPRELRLAVAQRLLAGVETKYEKMTLFTDIVAKIGPMLGLLCTLIPLGPGIIALSNGDPATLSQSLSIAFNATIVGLLNAGLSHMLSSVRKYWYNDYLVSLESVMEAVNEKAKPAGDEETQLGEHILVDVKQDTQKEARAYA